MKTRFDVGDKLFLIYESDTSTEWNIRGPQEVKSIMIDDDGTTYKCEDDITVIEKEDNEELFVFNDPSEAFEAFHGLWYEKEDETEDEL